MKKQNVETIVLKTLKLAWLRKSSTSVTTLDTGQSTFGKPMLSSLNFFQTFLLRKARCWHTSCRKHSRRKINSLGRTKR